jgi:hypothetical protein
MRTLKPLFLVFFLTTIAYFCPAQAPGWVVIPVDEYGALRAKAYPAEVAPEPAPVAATLTRVDYQLRLDSTLATGQANLTVDILQDGWVRVPIPAGLLVREARVGDRLGSSGFLGGSVYRPPSELPLNGRNFQQLVDTYNQTSDAKRKVAASPVRVSFPTVGPWLYLVCELTGEGKSATLDLNYQKEKKGGVK